MTQVRETNAYLRYTAGGNTFVAPPLKANGTPYSGTIAQLEVYVGEVLLNPTGWSHSISTGLVTLVNPVAPGVLVEIRRVTPLNESLVEFPTPDRYSSVHNNKAVAQWLALVQELWGAIKWLRAWGLDAIAKLYAYIDSQILWLKNFLMAYVNQSIAGVFQISGITGATCTLSVAAGTSNIPTPYRFNQGVLMLGGSMYNLSDPSHATLDNSGPYTVIILNEATIVNHEAILMIFGTDPGVDISYQGLQATSYYADVSSGSTEILVPYTFQQGLLILGGETYVIPGINPLTTVEDIGGVSTKITLSSPTVADHKAIVLMFGDHAGTFISGYTDATNYRLTVAAGETVLSIPHAFTKGILILGGETYALPEDATLADIGGTSTTITLPAATIVEHEALVVMFTPSA